MTPALLLPAGLAALVALAIPLVIHIARASEATLTDFAALRWLRERPRPRHRIRFDEWPLLIARLLLLALLALWLAHPVLEGNAGGHGWVLVAPGADASGEAKARWLAPGFPGADKPAPTGPMPIGSLLREADATLAPGAPLTVLVPAQIEGADAERPKLSRPVTWRIVPGRMAAQPAPKPAPFHLALRYAPGAEGLRYARAVALALAPDADIAPVGKSLPAGGALFWFVPGRLPAEVSNFANAGGTVLAINTATGLSQPASTLLRDRQGGTLIEGNGRLLHFARPLTPAAIPELLDPDFAARIGDLLHPPLPAPSRVAAVDYAPELGGPAPTHTPTELRPWLALLIAAVLLAERWLATSRRRAPAP